MLHGDGISFLGGGEAVTVARAVDPSIPVHGPFSVDFRWVTLKGWAHGAIQLSDGQSAIMKLLWEANGAKVERVMQKVGTESDRPYDLFKLKPHEKGVPEHEGPLFAYRALVVASRSGSYAIPRDKAASLVL